MVVLVGCAGQRVREFNPDVVSQNPEVSAEILKQFEVSELKPPTPPTGPEVANRALVKSPPKPKKVKKFKYPDRRPKTPDVVRVGESLSYDVSFLGLVAGSFVMTIKPPKEVNGRQVFHMEGRAKSSSLFSRFYELDDVFESFVDQEGYFSHRFQTQMDETKQYRKSLEFHDSIKKTTTYSNMRRSQEFGNEDRHDTVAIAPFPQDILSMLLWVRAQPALVEGKHFRFPYISEARNMEMDMEVLRREEIWTPLGSDTKCVVIKPVIWHEGNPKPGEIQLWFTDDDRRFLVRVEASVKIGTVKAIATEIVPGPTSG